VNPRNACLKLFPIRVEGDDILVDIDEMRTLEVAVDEEKER